MSMLALSFTTVLGESSTSESTIVMPPNPPGCSAGAKVAKETWKKWGPWKLLPPVTYKQKVKKFKKLWNALVASNTSWATLGPRYMEIGSKVDQGKIVPQTKRTFVTAPANKNSVVITIEKYDGRAKTGVSICIHGKNGDQLNKKNYTFPNDRASKTKKFTITGTKGKIISVSMKNHSAGNKFLYKINCK